MKDTERKHDKVSEKSRLMDERREIDEISEEQREQEVYNSFWSNNATWWTAGIIIVLAIFFIIWLWN